MSTSLLLHFDGADASTTFTDEVGHTMTRVNSPVIATAQSVFGGASGDFRNTNRALTTAGAAEFNLGTGDFTYETFFYCPVVNTGFGVFFDTGSQGFAAQFDATTLYLIFVINGSIILTSSAHGMTSGNWYYLAWKRASGVCTIHIGTSGATSQIGSVSNSTSCNNSTTVNVMNYSGAAGYSPNAYADEMRLTKGEALDVSTVPSSAFTYTPPSSSFVQQVMRHHFIPNFIGANHG